MARGRKLGARTRRVRKVNSVLAGGIKLAASLASTAFQAMIPTVATAAKKRRPQKKAPAIKVAKAKPAATVTRATG